MATLDPTKISELDQASARVAAGNTQAAVKDATGKVINAGDLANIEYATKKLGYSYKPAQGNTGLADAVQKTNFQQGTGIQGYDAALASQGTTTNTIGGSDADWMEDWMKDAFGKGEQAAVDTIKAPTFDVEKARLETAKTNRLAALDAQYATDLATTQKRNKDLGSSLKARLMKLGVSPSDSAWSNAEAGQAMRDAEAESALRSEYLSNKAKIEADSDAQLTTLAMNEATMKFNATVKNIENKLQTQAQGINLYQIFSQRDQSEKDREQSAYNAALDYQGKMATLDQAQQEAVAKNFIDSAQKGLYNISDKATLEMLSKLEKESPYLKGLVDIATSGLSDRLDKKAENAAQLNLIKEQTAAASRSNRGSGSGSGDKEAEAFYKDIDAMADDLASGKRDWGQAYNYLTGKYGTDIGTEIDALLNKDFWSQKGAYEKRAAERKATQPPIVISTGG